MHRMPVLLSVVAVVLLGTLVVARLTLGTAAQDATPAFAAHPLVGSWVAANLAEPSRPVLLATFWADGNALVTGPGGFDAPYIAHGAWAATGPRTAALTVVFITIDPVSGAPDGRYTLSGAVEVDATGGAFRGEGDIEDVGLDGTLRATAHLELVGTRIAAQSAGTPEPGTAKPTGAPEPATPAGTNPSAGERDHVDLAVHFAWEPELIAHHWCKPVAGGFVECLIYASDDPDAPLVAVEEVVDEATYQSFDPAEQRLWHSNVAEAAAGADPNRPAPSLEEAAAEAAAGRRGDLRQAHPPRGLRDPWRPAPGLAAGDLPSGTEPGTPTP